MNERMQSRSSISTLPVGTRPRRLALIAGGLLAYCALGVGTAAAQSGDIRLHLETGVLGFTAVDEETNGMQGRDDSSIRLGLFPAELGFGAGFRITPAVMLGFNTYVYMDNGGDGDSYFRLKFLPYFEYMFRAAGSSRPFLGLTAGIDHEDRDGPDSHTGIVFGGIGGIHIMLGGGASFDLSGRLTYEGRERGNTDISTLAFTILIGLSAWT